VRFEVDAPADLEVSECNCSMCRRSGILHLIVPKSRFRLLSGEDALTRYTFNTGTAQHLFCSTCGIGPSTCRAPIRRMRERALPQPETVRSVNVRPLTERTGRSTWQSWGRCR
jgi:hypothetical protein